MRAKRIHGMTAAERATALAADGLEVFRHYSGAGGLKEEFEQIAAANPRIAKLVTIGQTHQGQDIVALKVTKNANQMPDGKRPSVLYLGAQHAREWITPEMVRRLAHHYLDGYAAGDAQIAPHRRHDRAVVPARRQSRRLRLDVPGGPAALAQEPARQQRRRGDRRRRRRRPQPQLRPQVGLRQRGLRAVRRSATPTAGPARTPSRRPRRSTRSWRGSTSRSSSTTTRPPSCCCYGVGWQVATPTPDDVIYEAMAGDDAHPAVPGYDPDISAELYTTNGDTDSHAQALYGTLGFTPEMATCESASDEDPDDEWEAEDCGSGFEFPDDEALVQAEFERNIPFALVRRAVGARPGRPGVGRRPRGRGLPRRTRSTSPTATRRPSRCGPSAR